MDDDSATEMDSNHPLPAHHQHHLDVNLNDSKKRTNNNHQVWKDTRTPTHTSFAFDCQRHFSLIKPVIITRRYP